MRISLPNILAVLSALLLTASAPVALAYAAGCPAGTVKKGERIERSETETEIIFTHIPICEEVVDKCAALKQKAERDLALARRNQAEAQAGQEEMKAWGEMNQEAQLETIRDAITYLGGEYAANAEPAQDALAKLVKDADKLAKQTANAKKAAERTQYAVRLQDTLTKMKPALEEVWVRKGVGAAVGVEKKWEVARAELHLIFNNAVTGNDELRQIVSDPRFHKAFYDPNDTSPEAELLKKLGDMAVHKGAKLALKAKQFATFTGPGVRALSFVTDLAYDLTKNYLSAQRAVQWSEVAGQFARAAAALQGQYKRSFDAYRACKAGGG